MKTARYQESIQRYLSQCNLCPHHCVIGDGKTGRCRVRENTKGEINLLTYGIVSSMGFDPIEKKPLYHFYPGKDIFSIGSFGCTLKCRFCQNWEISQDLPNHYSRMKRFAPEELVMTAASKKGNIGIAYTYNEPTVWFEFMLDIAAIARKYKMKNVMITNGFINPEPMDELLTFIDAFNVDLKAFTEEFYRTLTFSSLEPVKETLLRIKKAGKHLEITNLVIPELNDQTSDFTEMIHWISTCLGGDTPLHLSRYFPNYKLNQSATTAEDLKRLYNIAKTKLKYVYIGNLAGNGSQNTECPSCNSTVIYRNRYNVLRSGLQKNGTCKNFGEKISGFF